ncbi:DUF1998 domain-containing protein [Methanobrevibacter sp.]|uniref:DUF1998 domain-containing protein n=1 Tax=Methanobrevibacter sp. TaxID=66852 RepID=UPI0025D7215E|nr:DUF1998 domain-containing protein [Methanobrevibacter sp.]MBQ2831144.1 DUF1998 domain-containing protein [Methanobrevibacter sp.]
MARRTQPLMRSQYILTYGPGSIIESSNGPRLIPSLKIGLGKDFDKYVDKYQVPDIRLEHLVNTFFNSNDNVRFFQLPSNDSEGEKEHKGLYKTMIFPVWKICYNNKEHDSNTNILFNSKYHNDKCPCCGKSKYSNPVRFVCACYEGHLDEVPWKYAIHSSGDCDHGSYFEWDAKGNSLDSIKLRCPKCEEETTMKKIASATYNCHSRHPETETIDRNSVGYSEGFSSREDPPKHMRVIQRQSSSLRIPLNRTLLILPENDKPCLRVIQNQDSTQRDIILKLIENYDDENIRKIYLDLLKDDVKQFIEKDRETFFDEAKRLYNKQWNYQELIEEEFEVLNNDLPVVKDNFEKDYYNSFNADFDGIPFEFKVSPINKIKTITTQYAYQRNIRPEGFSSKDEFDESNLKPVDVGSQPKLGNEKWYPAFESIGEGIFITSNLNPLDNLKLSNSVPKWRKLDFTELSYFLLEDIDMALLVWWHSLSHAIIRALGYISGYSSASIRERIYITRDNRGGILLYNTSAGDDSGMGGLINSAKNFDNVLDHALNIVNDCSNDPLCHAMRFGGHNVNGAACINCMFLSETSCEYGNRFLDRHLLLGD